MGQQVRRRPQGNIAFQANSKVSLPLSRGMIYRDIYLKYYGTLDDATNVLATTLHGDEWGAVKRIDLIANNTDVLRSLSGNQLWWLNYFMYGNPPNVTPRIADTAADPPFMSFLTIPLWMFRSLRPMDTALDARELSDLKIEISWGDFDDINSAATAWIVEPVIEIHSLESFGATGPFSQQRVYAIEKSIAATAAQFQLQLPVGPMYRGFLLNFTEGAGAAIADATAAVPILNNFKIISGTTVFADIPAQLLNVCDRHRQGCLRAFDAQVLVPAGGVYDNLRRGQDFNNVEGWYFYDHVTDGYLSECIDTLGFSEFELELNVTAGAASRVFVLPIQVIPVRGK